MNLIDIHQLLALKAVELGDESYTLRVIFRWYSKTFHVPLTEVDAIPLEDVLQTYFESRYEELEPDARELVIRDLLMSPEEKEALLLAKEADRASDEDFHKELEKEAAAGPAKESVGNRLANVVNKLAETLDKLPPPTNTEHVPELKLEPETVFEFEDDEPEPFI